MNKRQLAAENTRKKLMNAALDILKKRDFNAVSVEDITKKAQVAKGTFYTYFKRKEDIVVDICREPFRTVIEEIENIKNKNIIDKLALYFKRFMESIEIYDIHVCRSWICDVIDPNHSTKEWDSQKWQYDVEQLQNILNKAIKNKELKADTPIELLSHIIISELYGMMLCWCMSDGKFEPLDWTEKFCNAQLKLILKPYLLKGENQ
jgi:AcrR family transcriptional regulator